MSTGSSELLLDDRAQRRGRRALVGAVLAVLCAASLFINAGYGTFFDPVEVFSCYGLWIHQAFSSIAAPVDVLSPSEVLAVHRDYYAIVNRVGVTVMTALCGAVLAVAGSLYQSAFRNPIASPSMLGVSSAIQLGDALLVMTYAAGAASALGWRYLLCYLCVIAVMTVLFALTRLMTGKGRPMNVVNMLLVATIINQFIGVVITYITLFVFSWEQWEVFNNLSESITPGLDPLSWAVLLVTVFIGLAPVVALRFRLNGLSFADAEMKLLGVNSTRLRFLAIVSGTVLLMAAQVQMGTVAMLALVVPHVSRMVFGAEFRKQLWGNVMIGAALLVFCRDVIGFIPVVGNIIPVSVVLNFAVLPFFVWMLATQQRGWEQ